MPFTSGFFVEASGTSRPTEGSARTRRNKGLTTGQTRVNRWTDELLQMIEDRKIDPSFVVTHTADLAEGPELYRIFRDKQDSCIKVVLTT